MGVGCSFAAGTVRQKSLLDDEQVTRWRGHELYRSPDSSNPSLGSISPTRQRLTDEIQALYTCNQVEVLTIIHFNDVYNIESGDGVCGGAARFATVVKAYSDCNPLVLFSGDCLNPSILSTFTKGEHMVPILNALRVNTAVYGNHDFDFGVDDLEDIVKETQFPWLLSNVIDDFTGQMLADGIVTRLLTWQNKKIGLIGLVEEEWLVTLATVDRENVTYLDYVERGQKLGTELKEQGADYVIAITHMRLPNDIRLASETSAIDLILAGHDHDYSLQKVNGTYIVKSGSDFKSLSIITLEFTPHDININIEKVVIDQEVVEDDEMKVIVDRYGDVMKKEMEGKLGTIEVDLDARFASIRTQETNLGNLITDIMLAVLEADVALLNSGTFRSDRIHPAGDFKKRDLLTLLPLIDPLMVLEVTGDELYQALENGVSQYPKREGRFPQISGVRYGFYPSAPPGQRVDPLTVVVDGHCLLPDKRYRLCTKEYIANGKDGYKVFSTCPVLVNAEEGPVLTTVVQNHFHSAGIVQGLKPCRSGHRQSLVSLRSKRSLVKSASLVEVEQDRSRIAPRLEERITVMDEVGDWKDILAGHRKLFLNGSNEEVLEEWQRLCRLEEGNNDAEVTHNVISHTTDHPSLYPRVIITEASADDVDEETNSKGSAASASMLSFSAEEEGIETLHSAIRMDDIDTVTRLLKTQGGHFPDQDGSLLHLAVQHDSVQTVQYLLHSMSIDPNIQLDERKRSALMEAVCRGNAAIVQLLLGAGADPTKEDESRRSALDLAGEMDAEDMNKLIKEFKESRERLNGDDQSRI
nr:snake venom 5'-nucleotidase-like [Lytechinus pictus]